MENVFELCDISERSIKMKTKLSKTEQQPEVKQANRKETRGKRGE